MKRLLIYSPGLLPQSQTFVADQARALLRWDPILVGRERIDDGLPIDDLLASEMRTAIAAPNTARRLIQRTSRRVGVLASVAERARPQLIHAHFLTGGYDVAATLRPPPCPVVVTAHGFDATMFGSPRRTWRPDLWMSGVLRWSLLRQPLHFIAVSRFIRDQLLRYGAPERRVVVHHTGVDTSYFVPPPPQFPRRGILFVGRLVKKKGMFDLLQAVVRLRMDGIDAQVEVIGDGPERRSIERFIARERLPVIMRGSQPRSVVLEAMQRSAVLCGPSRTAPSGDREGFGMVLAEAQATGLPVVATTCGGMVDAVQHGLTGLLVREGDPFALAAALRSILVDDDLRQKMTCAARSWVVDHLDLTRQSARLEELYDSWAATTGS